MLEFFLKQIYCWHCKVLIYNEDDVQHTVIASRKLLQAIHRRIEPHLTTIQLVQYV